MKSNYFDCFNLKGEKIMLNVNAKVLLTAAKQSIFEVKSSMEVLQKILVTCDKNDKNLKIEATDLDCSTEFLLLCKKSPSFKAFNFMVNGPDLIDSVAMFSDYDIVTLTVKEDKLILSDTGNFSVELEIDLNVDDFPQLPEISSGKDIFIKSQDFKTLLDDTVYCISDDYTRPHICHGLLEINNKSLNLISTDGHRLAKSSAVTEYQNVNQENILVHRKALSYLGKLKLVDTVAIRHSDQHVAFSFSHKANTKTLSVVGTIYTKKELDYEFPPYDQVIPKEHNNSMKLSLDELHKALSRFKAGKSKDRKVELHLESELLTMKTDNNRQVIKQTLLPTLFEGSECIMGVNISFLTETIAAFKKGGKNGMITIKFAKVLDPLIIQDSKARCTTILMPMR